MKKSHDLSPAAQVAVVAIVLLGLLGGSLIVAYSGFGTSPRRGGASVFVPVPEAYLMAAAMYGMSFIGMLALLQNRQSGRRLTGLAVALYPAAAALLTTSLVRL